MRLVLIEQTPEEREVTVDRIMEAMFNKGCRRLMEAIEIIDPKFVEWDLDRLEEAQQTSTSFDLKDIDEEKHLLGNTPEKVAAGKERVAKLLKALAKDGFNSKDIAVFSAAIALATLYNAACLRPQDFFNLSAKTLYYIKVYKRLMIWLPEEGKQTIAANKKSSTACMEYGVEGAGVVRWWVVMSLVGRPFLKEHSGGQLDPLLGPLGADGLMLSEDVFGRMVKMTGRAYFWTANPDVNALRTVQGTLAAEHIMELGHTPDESSMRELAREQRTSVDVSSIL